MAWNPSDQCLSTPTRDRFHKISPKHLNRHVTAFAGKHNLREIDTSDRLAEIAIRLDGKQLRYRDLIAPNGLDSVARLTA